MENRLKPGSGIIAPRIAMFALLAAISILLVGIYWFLRRDTLNSQGQSAIETPRLMRSSDRLAFRREAMVTPSVTDSPVAPKLSMPSQSITRTPRPLPLQPSISQSVIDAMAQNDPEDIEEQGDDIAILKDEKAANPESVGLAIALSRRLMQAGRYNEAERELRQILQQSPAHPAARHQLGYILATQGQREEAIQEWRTLVQTGDPTWSSIAQGSITRITHPETPAIAMPDTPVPDLRPARPIIPHHE